VAAADAHGAGASVGLWASTGVAEAGAGSSKVPSRLAIPRILEPYPKRMTVSRIDFRSIYQGGPSAARFIKETP
jgi:hypothetical protein